MMPILSASLPLEGGGDGCHARAAGALGVRAQLELSRVPIARDVSCSGKRIRLRPCLISNALSSCPLC